VAEPWWSEARTATAALDDALKARTAIVRLLEVSRDSDHGPRGGEASYHVEALTPPSGLDERPADEWAAVIAPEPLRSAWATPAGVRDLIDWAAKSAGASLTDAPQQIKTWNLSCVFKLSTVDGPVWAKATPAFGNAEGAIINAVRSYDPDLSPQVIAHDPVAKRALMAHVPGEDCWNVSTETACAVVSRWVAVQAVIGERLSDIPALASPDPVASTGVLLKRLDDLTEAEAAAAYQLLGKLPELVAEAESAGLPHTLVHGDFHPGNWRSDGTHHAIIDWADSFAGNPAADVLRLTGWVPQDQREPILAAWVQTWRTHRPQSDPERALAPMRVIGHLLAAATYQRFLDGIEPAERIYHEGDPASEIRAATTAFLG
jgi:hypothetical protein